MTATFQVSIIASEGGGRSPREAPPPPPPDRRADSAKPRLRVGLSPKPVSQPLLLAFCTTLACTSLVEVHPLNAPLNRPKLRTPCQYSEQKANMLSFANGRRSQTCDRNHGSDSCEPAHANGGRSVWDSSGKPANGQADCGINPMG